MTYLQGECSYRRVEYAEEEEEEKEIQRRSRACSEQPSCLVVARSVHGAQREGGLPRALVVAAQLEFESIILKRFVIFQF